MPAPRWSRSSSPSTRTTSARIARLESSRWRWTSSGARCARRRPRAAGSSSGSSSSSPSGEPTPRGRGARGRRRVRAARIGAAPGTTHISVVDGTGWPRRSRRRSGRDRACFAAARSSTTCSASWTSSASHEKAPGERLASMMTPTSCSAPGGPELVIGSAGSVRLAGAIAQVTWRILRGMHVRRRDPRAATPRRGHDAPSRRRVARRRRRGAPGELGRQPLGCLNLFFGGVQAVERVGDGVLQAAGDPRRGGAGIVVE